MSEYIIVSLAASLQIDRGTYSNHQPIYFRNHVNWWPGRIQLNKKIKNYVFASNQF